jgi:phosphoglycerate dehydrogenase-like enzyme
MELSRPPLVVAFALSQKRKAIVVDALAGASAVVYLTELDETARAKALRNTGVLLTFNTSKELRPGEAKLLNGARLIQFMIGGVDFIPLGELPEGVPVATNGGGYAESMAEHALAMALAAAKRLVLEHQTSNVDCSISSRGTACSRAVSAEFSGLAASEPQPQG